MRKKSFGKTVRAEFVQDCSNGSPLLDYYADKVEDSTPEIKGRRNPYIRAVSELNFVAWFPFTVATMTSHYFKVQKFRYEGSMYVCVTNSAINYLFKIL